MLRLLVALLFGLSCWAQAPVKDVCTTLREIAQLHGQIVSVRGQYRRGLEIQDLVADCDDKLTVNGLPAFARIHVEWNRKPGRAFKKYCPTNGCTVEVTLIGRIVTVEDIEASGKRKPRGFGYRGWASAQIQVETFENAVPQAIARLITNAIIDR